ncbi:MAG: hypothetical protein ACTSUB_05675 [Candidatus Thorarchaeota archaeon]
MAASNDENDLEPSLWVSIFGGKKEIVEESLNTQLGDEGDAHMYNTWVNVSAMRRLGFLFVGGVESAGGVFDILCMFSVLAIILGVFVFWQVIVFFAVMVVLIIFSGGAAFKFVKGTYIEADAAKFNSTKLESFVEKQISEGYFVLTRSESGYNPGPITKQSTTATGIFRLGIHLSLIVATIFLIVELVYWWLSSFTSWLTDIPILIIFGAGFLIGIAIMDLGVILRRQLSKKLKLNQDMVL